MKRKQSKIDMSVFDTNDIVKINEEMEKHIVRPWPCEKCGKEWYLFKNYKIWSNDNNQKIRTCEDCMRKPKLEKGGR